MYRRNLDILLAAATALAGGAAYAAHLPGSVQIVLGVALYFAPGYLWSEAILSQRLPPTERLLTTAGLSLILPILGGFLFYALRIPLFRPDWVGLLVVLTLLGVVAVAVQRLREAPAEPRQDPRPDPYASQRGRQQQQPARKGGLSALNAFVWGVAGVVALGSVAYSVKSAEDQKYPGYTDFWLSPSPVSSATPGPNSTSAYTPPTQASLGVTNHQGVAEQYEIKLLTKGKVTSTWTFILSDGQSWTQTVPYTVNDSEVADLYLLPNVKTPYRYADNGEPAPPPATATPTPAKSQ
jgi:uncharacterized membrane protein